MPLFVTKTFLFNAYIFRTWVVNFVIENVWFLFTESIAYEFGPGRGIITYTFAPNALEDSDANKIALGFVTNKADAVLLRIESSNTQDYMQMEIVSVNGMAHKFIILVRTNFNIIHG